MTYHVETLGKDNAWHATGPTGKCPACKQPMGNEGHVTLDKAERAASRYKGPTRIVKIYREGLAYICR